MNNKKWEKIAKKSPAASTLLAKLMEEVGEVANALLEKSEEEILTELQHVHFITTQLRINVLKFGKQRED